MSLLLSLGILVTTQQPKTQVRIPVFNFDTSSKYSDSFYPALQPRGFSEVGTGRGEFSSKLGSILFTVSRSSGPVPVVQRNPKAKKDEEWTTIRLTNWVGYRNTVGLSEIYTLNWARHRLNVTLKFKSKKDIPALRKGLNELVDSLTIK